MRKLRYYVAPVVAIAGAILAADQDTFPHWVRGAAVGAVVLGAALGIPAVAPLTGRAAESDRRVS